MPDGPCGWLLTVNESVKDLPHHGTSPIRIIGSLETTQLGQEAFWSHHTPALYNICKSKQCSMNVRKLRFHKNSKMRL